MIPSYNVDQRISYPQRMSLMPLVRAAVRWWLVSARPSLLSRRAMQSTTVANHAPRQGVGRANYG
ncbi:hypothetical protein BHE90_013942, partial [Fusarium euwallaceae]